MWLGKVVAGRLVGVDDEPYQGCAVLLWQE